jgi:hypothetical protein
MKTMFIGQGSSVVGVCMVYDLNSLVHQLIAYINPINNRKKKREDRKEHREKQATRGKRQQEEKRETKRIERD